MPQKNMYSDSIFQWNVFKGCNFDCVYCRPSFQRQAKRQKPKFDENGVQYRGCQDCYDYKPHFHEERLNINFNLKKYETLGDQFIWVGSSGDISFCKEEWMILILERIRKFPNRTFFFQTKNPIFYLHYYKQIPSNCILGITLETDKDENYELISKAMKPSKRMIFFGDGRLKDFRKIITIEPILDFGLESKEIESYNFVDLIKFFNPIRVYIGYDTKKCGLPEPPISKTLKLIKSLRQFGIKVKTKYMKEVI